MTAYAIRTTKPARIAPNGIKFFVKVYSACGHKRRLYGEQRDPRKQVSTRDSGGPTEVAMEMSHG
jgi:hypothetical protein